MSTFPLSRRALPARRAARSLLLAALTATLAACGGPTALQERTDAEVAAIVAAAYAPGAAVTPSGATMPVGGTVQLTAVDAAGRAVVGATWSSSDPGVAAVGADGGLTAGARGAATITAASKIRSASAQIAVTAPPPPPSGTAIAPGEDIQARVDAAAPGTRFVLKAGIHRLQHVRPKDGMVFAGETGAVLSGARLLTGFTRSGSAWVADGPPASRAAGGRGFGACTGPRRGGVMRFRSAACHGSGVSRYAPMGRFSRTCPRLLIRIEVT